MGLEEATMDYNGEDMVHGGLRVSLLRWRMGFTDHVNERRDRTGEAMHSHTKYKPN